MMTKNMTLVATVALTLGAFACHKDEDKAGQTNTTSAQAPMDPTMQMNDGKDGGTMVESATPVNPLKPVAPVNPADPNLNGSPRSDLKPGTQVNGAGVNTTTGKNSLPEDTQNNVAPGHIMFPPDKGPGTGQPNSAGSHNMGAGGQPAR